MEKNKRILIVDDDKFLLDMYSIKFREGGFDVEIGDGGEEGLQKLRAGLEVDVIMLDLVMPGIDGFAFLEAIKRENLGGTPKLIVLSNQGQDEEIKQAQDMGADEYIVKASAIPSEVLEQVKKIVG